MQKLFSDSAHNFYEKLTNTIKPYITFQFLDLLSFSLSDEIYIKMNARGKPLTIFENFKAKLEQKIQSFEGPWPTYQLSFKGGHVDGYEYFIHKVDTDWANLFWPYRNENSDDNNFDDEIMNFIRLIIAYQYLIDKKEQPIEAHVISDDIFGRNGQLEPLTLSKYEELNCLNKDFFVRLISILDLIYNDGLADNKIKNYTANGYHYSEEKTFISVLKNDASYDDKLRFYAFYSFMVKSPNVNELTEWLRVVYNLTENTIINTSDEFFKAFWAIDKLCQSKSPILESLVNDIEISGFTGAQITEEKIKAHLLSKSQEWREVIVAAEKHSFLKGQIGCILSFADILSYYRENQNCDWALEQDNEFLLRFNLYSSAVQSIFDQIEGSSSSIDYLWERAVLTKGVYFTDKRGDKFNMLSTRDTRNNIPRDHSWKRLLRFGTLSIEKKQSYVKAVIDDPLFDTSDLKGSLAAICRQALLSSDIEPWQKLLIQHKELIDYCKQGFIEKSHSEFILLNESQRNHYHSELFTKVLVIELNENKSLLKPFSHIRYEPVKSREDSAHAILSGFVFCEQQYQIEIYKAGSVFDIRVKGGDIGNAPENLRAIFEDEGFKFRGLSMPSFGFHNYFSETNQLNIEEVKAKLLKLCASLREITTGIVGQKNVKHKNV